MIQRRCIGWLFLGLSSLGFAWLVASLLFYPPVHEEKVHPLISETAEANDPWYVPDGGPATIWIAVNGDQTIEFVLNDYSDDSDYMNRVFAQGEEIDESVYPHTRRKLTRLIEKAHDRAALTSMRWLSKNPLERTRWQIRHWVSSRFHQIRYPSPFG